MSSKLSVISPGEDGGIHKSHPHCIHGPSLLFYTEKEGVEKGFYACAAYREKSFCNFQMPVAKVTPQRLEQRFATAFVFDKELGVQIRRALCAGRHDKFHYCHGCNQPFLSGNIDEHSGHQGLRLNLDVADFDRPWKFLWPCDDDEGQAQYFFDEKALRFFKQCFKDLGIRKIVCIGAPRLHQFIREECPELQSFLLDMDIRLLHFLDDSQFAWYNMCNNHFFDARQEQCFQQFLKCDNDEQLLLLTDPPFACRTEPIAHMLRSLTSLHNRLNRLTHRPLPIFWIFPYFAKHYVQNEMSSLQMCDYKVNYSNHKRYTDVGAKGRQFGSPVRVFTNVPLERIQLPVTEQYRYCAACKRYTALNNRHCSLCNDCPSQNGAQYRHCKRCDRCVKSYYVHCMSCSRCVQHNGHNCEIYQTVQRCAICLQRGHIERNCTKWLSHCKRIGHTRPLRALAKLTTLRCLLCGHSGHNVGSCRKRSKYLKVSKFLNEQTVKFRESF